jgi:hypothetical protein
VLSSPSSLLFANSSYSLRPSFIDIYKECSARSYIGPLYMKYIKKRVAPENIIYVINLVNNDDYTSIGGVRSRVKISN